jgi:hypothetical protein
MRVCVCVVCACHSVAGQARCFQSTPMMRGGAADHHDDVGGHNGWLFGKNVSLTLPVTRACAHTRSLSLSPFVASFVIAPCSPSLTVRSLMHAPPQKTFSRPPSCSAADALALYQPDETSKREKWEIPYYIAAASSLIILGVGLTYKPKTSIKVPHHIASLSRSFSTSLRRHTFAQCHIAAALARSLARALFPRHPHPITISSPLAPIPLLCPPGTHA